MTKITSGIIEGHRCLSGEECAAGGMRIDLPTLATGVSTTTIARCISEKCGQANVTVSQISVDDFVFTPGGVVA